MVKNPPAMQETWIQSLVWEDPLEEGMRIPCSILHAWSIPWTEEPGRIQSMVLQRVGHDWATKLNWTYHSASHWIISAPRWENLCCTTSWNAFCGFTISVFSRTTRNQLLGCRAFQAGRCCWITQLCPTLCNPMGCSLPGSCAHGDSPGKNTGVGCHALLQGSFWSQGLNPVLPHCKQILYRLSHQGSPLNLEGVWFSRRDPSWSIFSSIYQELMVNKGIHVEVNANRSYLLEHQRCVPGTAYTYFHQIHQPCEADTVFTLQVRRRRVRELAWFSQSHKESWFKHWLLSQFVLAAI